jgi:hypothetical protein
VTSLQGFRRLWEGRDEDQTEPVHAWHIEIEKEKIGGGDFKRVAATTLSKPAASSSLTTLLNAREGPCTSRSSGWSPAIGKRSGSAIFLPRAVPELIINYGDQSDKVLE